MNTNSEDQSSLRQTKEGKRLISKTALIELEIRKWRILTNHHLRMMFDDQISDELLKKALWRLRRKGRIRSVKIEDRWIHFYRSLGKRFSILESLEPWPRGIRFGSSEMFCHFGRLDFAIELARAFPDFSITPIIFSAREAFRSGASRYEGTKFTPDLILSHAGDRNAAFISFLSIAPGAHSSSRNAGIVTRPIRALKYACT